MKVTFLGTGTSQGIPVISCSCKVCLSTGKRDKRLRTSILIESKFTSVVIDTGPDFRQQMLREKVKKLDAVLFTHAHKDHTAGLDEVRAFNFTSGKPMKVYATSAIQKSLRVEYAYAFDRNNDYPGLPKINLKEIRNREFSIGEIDFTPVEVLHYRLPVFGYRIADFTYITDANFISEKEMKKIRGTRVLVLNALRKKKHVSHFSLNEAIDLSKRVDAERTYFIHLSHQMGIHTEISRLLPRKMFLSYDGLQLEI